MNTYLAFLRGINVGGNSLIKMADLRACLDKAGFSEVTTYIQSGNVILSSKETDKKAVARKVALAIKQSFGLNILVAMFTKDEWLNVIESAPSWWGKDDLYKHNILICVKPDETQAIVSQIGELRPEVESLKAGEGVLYQSILISAIGKGVTGNKLIANSVYSSLTVRNYNTATKLANLLSVK
jgi:uncharacterized protein (DUF1697 family)